MELAGSPSSFSRALDRAVLRAHRVHLGDHKYHPYFVATDLAGLASLVTAYLYTRRFQDLPFPVFFGEFVAVLALYKVFLRLKARALGQRSRSFLQDTVLFLVPAYAVLNLILGYPLRAAFDLTGLISPLYLGTVRVGCFLGGCCYGVPWSQGVLYPRSIFETQSGCRSFTPGADPGRRVFPVQLAEAAGSWMLFAAMATWAWRQTAPRGLLMPFFLAGYSVLRFALDFVRRSSARPRRGPFSEAQVFCVGTAAVSLFLISWLGGLRQ